MLNYKSSTKQIRRQIGGVGGHLATNPPVWGTTAVGTIAYLLGVLVARSTVVEVALWIALAVAALSQLVGKLVQRITVPWETVKQDFLYDAEGSNETP